MKFTDARLASFIRRDPVAVSYTVGTAPDLVTVSTNGLMHRPGRQRAQGDSEDSAGKKEREELAVLLRAVDIGDNIPAEGTVMTVAGKAYRSGICERASDLSHYVVVLFDQNG